MYKGNPFDKDSVVLKNSIYSRSIKKCVSELNVTKGRQLASEVLDMCQQIENNGEKNDLNPEYTVIPYGELYDMYDYIPGKFSTFFLTAKKNGFIYFEKDILCKGRDNKVPVYLVRTGAEIKMQQAIFDEEDNTKKMEQARNPYG